MNSRLFWLSSARPAFVPLNTDVNNVGAPPLPTCFVLGPAMRLVWGSGVWPGMMVACTRFTCLQRTHDNDVTLAY